MKSSSSAHFAGLAEQPRRRKVPRDAIRGVNNSSIRKLARRGGVKRIRREIYDTTNEALVRALRSVVFRAGAIADREGRSTINTLDIIQALRETPWIRPTSSNILASTYVAEFTPRDLLHPQAPAQSFGAAYNITSLIDIDDSKTTEVIKVEEPETQHENNLSIRESQPLSKTCSQPVRDWTYEANSDADDELGEDFLDADEFYYTEDEEWYDWIEQWRFNVQPGEPT